MATDPPVCTREEAMRAAAAVYSRALTRIAHLTPEEAADAAYIPGGKSREELAELVRRLRAEHSACQRAA